MSLAAQAMLTKGPAAEDRNGMNPPFPKGALTSYLKVLVAQFGPPRRRTWRLDDAESIQAFAFARPSDVTAGRPME